MSRHLIIFVILAAGIGVLLYWFSLNFEWREQEVNTGPGAAAIQNPFLAAERFLKKTGSEVSSISSMLQIDGTPGKHDILILPTQRYDFGAKQTEQFREWARNGGHLIVLARNRIEGAADNQDFLLDPLGIELIRQDGTSSSDEDDEQSDVPEEKHETANVDKPQEVIEKQAKQESQNNEHLVSVYYDDSSEQHQLDVDKHRVLDFDANTPPAWYVADDNGYYVLEYKIGEGWLTVLNDFGLFSNSQIDKYDHAAFLWRLTHIDGHRGKIWLVHRENMPPLSSILWKYAWPVFVSAFFLLVYWLWTSSRRFGPVLADPPPVRRSLREHISASGYFLWREGYAEKLLENVRRSLLAKIEFVHPNWIKLDRERLYRRLKESSGLEIDAITQAMEVRGVEREQVFLQHVRTLEYIRKNL